MCVQDVTDELSPLFTLSCDYFPTLANSNLAIIVTINPANYYYQVSSKDVQCVCILKRLQASVHNNSMSLSIQEFVQPVACFPFRIYRLSAGIDKKRLSRNTHKYSNIRNFPRVCVKTFASKVNPWMKFDSNDMFMQRLLIHTFRIVFSINKAVIHFIWKYEKPCFKIYLFKKKKKHLYEGMI